jgi:hypothetical protein
MELIRPNGEISSLDAVDTNRPISLAEFLAQIIRHERRLRASASAGSKEKPGQIRITFSDRDMEIIEEAARAWLSTEQHASMSFLRALLMSDVGLKANITHETRDYVEVTTEVAEQSKPPNIWRLRIS